MSELKTPRKCPFCGERPTIHQTGPGHAIIRCEQEHCFIRPTTVDSVTTFLAIIRWNATPTEAKDRKKARAHFKKVKDWKIKVPALKTPFKKGFL